MTQLAEGPIRNEIISGGTHDHGIEYLIDLNKENDGTDKDSQHRTNDVPSQYFEMIDEAHFSFFTACGSESLEERLIF